LSLGLSLLQLSHGARNVVIKMVAKAKAANGTPVTGTKMTNFRPSLMLVLHLLMVMKQSQL